MLNTTIPAVRVPLETRNKLRELSKKIGLTESELIRIAIETYIKSKTK